MITKNQAKSGSASAGVYQRILWRTQAGAGPGCGRQASGGTLVVCIGELSGRKRYGLGGKDRTTRCATGAHTTQQAPGHRRVSRPVENAVEQMVALHLAAGGRQGTHPNAEPANGCAAPGSRRGTWPQAGQFTGKCRNSSSGPPTRTIRKAEILRPEA